MHGLNPFKDSRILVSAPVPMGTNNFWNLVGWGMTCFFLVTRGLGLGLDNKKI